MPEFIVLPEPEGKKLGLDDFTRGYLECAVWLAKRWDGQDPTEAESGRWSLADIETESADEAKRECKDFQDANRTDLDDYEAETGRDAANQGHDFFLSRNRHGTGFWDRGLGEVGEALHAAAKVYGTWQLEIVGDHLVAHG